MFIHFDNLRTHIENFDSLKMLDVGSGRGKFLLYAAQNNMDVTGLEKNSAYIDIILDKAKGQNLDVDILQGEAEHMPFDDNSFGFVNLSELIEHVEDPDKLLSETHRVMKSGAYAYISVPARFGLRDPHFHLYFVNWLPRKWCNAYIGLFGKHKDYKNKNTGRQNLAEMHYYRLKDIVKLLQQKGFEVLDIRTLKINKIKNKPKKFFLRCLYRVMKSFYFDTFHLLLKK